MIDSNDRERMNESKDLFDRMIKNEYLSGVPLLILANKQVFEQKMFKMVLHVIFVSQKH